MIKKFKDVREGDTIYIISPDSAEIKKCKVYRCQRNNYYNGIYIYLYVMNHDVPVIEVRDFKTKSGYTFTTIEQAEERLSTIIQNKHKRLEKIIDQKVEEYDKLVESLELLEQQVSNSTDETKNLVYFKDIKIGDFIFWINKADLKIEKIKAKKIEKKINPYRQCQFLTFRLSKGGDFNAYPNSTISLSKEFYIDSRKAFLGLITYVRKRIKTVGNRMEMLMKEFYKLEKLLVEDNIDKVLD